MHELRLWLSEVAQQRLGFTLVVVATLGVFGFIGAVLFLPAMVDVLVGPTAAAHAAQHFRSPSHRIHDLTFSFLFATSIIGLLSQLRAPSKNIAGQMMAVIPWLGLALVIPLTRYWVPPGTGFQIVATIVFGGLTVGATFLHPSGSHLFSSFAVARASRVMTAMVIVAAVPLAIFVSTNLTLQRTGASGNEHYDLGHYGFMAAFGFTVLAMGWLASRRPTGWRLSAWVAGLLSFLLGTSSLLSPDVDSSLDPVWAIAAMAWGVAFIAVEVRTRHSEHTVATT